MSNVVPFDYYVEGGKYRTKRANDLESARKAFLKSLLKKGYSERGAKMLFGKEEKEKELISNTRKYKGKIEKKVSPKKKLQKEEKKRKPSAWNQFLKKHKKEKYEGESIGEFGRRMKELHGYKPKSEKKK